MLIDKNKNKVVTQAITEAAAIASRVEPGGNMTCAQVCQKHGKAVSVGAVTSLSQSTVGFFPLKGNGYPTHFLSIVLCHQLCFLAAVPARGVSDCSILIP